MSDGVTDAKLIGERLELTRTALGLNQTEFAQLANINLSAYNRYESGQKRPSYETLYAICQAFNLTSDWLLFGEPANMPQKLMLTITHLRKSRIAN